LKVAKLEAADSVESQQFSVSMARFGSFHVWRNSALTKSALPAIFCSLIPLLVRDRLQATPLFLTAFYWFEPESEIKLA